MFCKVCAFPTVDGRACPNCGFDDSQDYEQFSTLFLADGADPISKRKQNLIINANDAYCCPKCGGKTFLIFPGRNEVFCVSCRNKPDLFIKIKTPDSSKTGNNSHEEKELRGFSWGVDLESHTLTVYGQGEMSDYLPGKTPWFKHWYHVKTVVVKPVIKSIGENAFCQFRSMEEIRLPASLRRIGFGAFTNCSRLKNIYFEGTLLQWEKIQIGENNEALISAVFHARANVRG